jgi:hypothetical protein
MPEKLRHREETKFVLLLRALKIIEQKNLPKQYLKVKAIFWAQQELNFPRSSVNFARVCPLYRVDQEQLPLSLRRYCV